MLSRPRPRFAPLLAALLCGASGALAQSLPAQAPPAPQRIIEGLRQQEQPDLAPRLEPPPLEAISGPGAQQRLRIGRVSVEGQRGLPAARLNAVAAPLAGREVALAEIEQTRLELLRLYREAGFPFSTIAATVSPGAPGAELRFAVTEGFVAEVRLEGDIGPAGTQVLRFLNPLIGQRPLSAARLERALLLASDIPGVTVRGVLRPLASEPGALQLVARLERQRFGGYANADNRAYELTGPTQGLLVAGANAFTALGERSEILLYGAEGDTQWFAQGSFEAFAGGSGLRLRGYAGMGEARPGSSLAAIGYAGETRLAGLVASYPIIRSRPMNLGAVLQFDAFEGTVDTGSGAQRQRASRDSVRSLRGGFDFQALDDWLGGPAPAANTAGLRLHHGLSGLGATANGDPLAARAESVFDYRKLTFELGRTQPLFSLGEGSVVSLFALGAGQWSDEVLPNVEKFFLGGARLGRGFYAGQVTGDSALAGSLELQLDTRLDIADPVVGAFLLRPQFYGFLDRGQAFQNNDDPNRRVSSWGVGVRVFLDERAQFDVEAVRRVTRNVDGAAAAPLSENAVYWRLLLRY
jgi:hemolysin activation/secretion protein